MASVDNWDEIRTAYHVARLGTVSGAAEVLGVHHATVIRHIDALETRLGAKLFQRHARGYSATEAGNDLLKVAQTTDDQFTQLAGRIRGRGEEVTGELIVTTLSDLAALLIPSMVKFQDEHPELIVRLLTGERVFRLEYGEAHVAIRAGSAPNEPDNVVQPFISYPTALYAHRSYVARYGKPDGPEAFASHRFIALDDEETRAPFGRWLWRTVPRENIVYRASHSQMIEDAVEAGVGIGFMSLWPARNKPELVQIMPPDPALEARTWLVTHVDLHRTAKVQAFLSHLKERSKEWGAAG